MKNNQKAKTILTDFQNQVLRELFLDEWFRRYFYLTGGTALSEYYLHHRYSDDLDFFSHDIDIKPFLGLIKKIGKKLNQKIQPITTAPSFMRFTIGDNLKIDVVGDVGFRVGVPELIDGMMIDSIKNLAVNKVGAILGRLDAKDYVDLYFLLSEYSFDVFDLLELGIKKDAGLEPFIWSTIIADVDRLMMLPRMIKPVTFEELKTFYFALRDKILDRIKPSE